MGKECVYGGDLYISRFNFIIFASSVKTDTQMNISKILKSMEKIRTWIKCHND